MKKLALILVVIVGLSACDSISNSTVSSGCDSTVVDSCKVDSTIIDTLRVELPTEEK